MSEIVSTVFGTFFVLIFRFWKFDQKTKLNTRDFFQLFHTKNEKVAQKGSRNRIPFSLSLKPERWESLVPKKSSKWLLHIFWKSPKPHNAVTLPSRRSQACTKLLQSPTFPDNPKFQAPFLNNTLRVLDYTPDCGWGGPVRIYCDKFSDVSCSSSTNLK